MSDEMTTPSTRSLAALPDVATVRRISQAVAMLEAILSPEWEARYYSFDGAWGPGEEMASMRDGSGDEYFILFGSAGAIMKGFAHEAAMSPYRTDPPRVWPGIYEAVPDAFESFLREPAFAPEDVTFCIWRTGQDRVWQCGVADFPAGPDPDGSEELLRIFDARPDTYRRFAEQYYETRVPLESVERFYRLAPLTDELVAGLNPALRAADVESDAVEIGYPRGA